MKKINLDINSINTIEDYLLHLAVFSVSLNGLANLQKVAYKKGIFSQDEIENSQTIVYEIERLFTVINDQINLVSARSPLEWKETLKKVEDLLQLEKESADKLESKEKGD